MDRDTRITLEDGATYDLKYVHLPNQIKAHAMVVTEKMKAVAASMLNVAQHMSDSRSARAAFYHASELGLGVAGGIAYAKAEAAAHEAKTRLAVLKMVSMGESVDGTFFVTVEGWRDVLAFFKQDVSTGAEFAPVGRG